MKLDFTNLFLETEGGMSKQDINRIREFSETAMQNARIFAQNISEMALKESGMKGYALEAKR